MSAFYKHNQRFCKVCDERFTDAAPRSDFCNYSANVCKPCRVEEMFREIENHAEPIGKCSFCHVKMTSLPPVPPTWSDRLHLSPRPETPDWESLRKIFRALGNSVRTVFQGANEETEHVTHSIAGRIVWEGTASEETANRLRLGG